MFRYLSYFVVQNKSKRPETKSPERADRVKENVLAPDTGQSLVQEPTLCQEEPQAAAAASISSPTNNNSNNYNLVTSLLNLTKSPVSNSTRVCSCFIRAGLVSVLRNYQRSIFGGALNS